VNLDPRFQAEIRQVLEVQLEYTARAPTLQPDGTSIRARGGGPSVPSQDRLCDLRHHPAQLSLRPDRLAGPDATGRHRPVTVGG
jgi:hypothetical protein